MSYFILAPGDTEYKPSAKNIVEGGWAPIPLILTKRQHSAGGVDPHSKYLLTAKDPQGLLPLPCCEYGGVGGLHSNSCNPMNAAMTTNAKFLGRGFGENGQIGIGDALALGRGFANGTMAATHTSNTVYLGHNQTQHINPDGNALGRSQTNLKSNLKGSKLIATKELVGEVLEEQDLVIDEKGTIKAINPPTVRPGSQDNKHLLKNQSFGASRVRILNQSSLNQQSPDERIDSARHSQGGTSPASRRNQGKQPATDTFTSGIEEYNVNHMKNVIDKLYGRDIDMDKEYPDLGSAKMYKNLILEAERKQMEADLFVAKRRGINIMKKIAGDMERELELESKRMEECNTEVERAIKLTEIKAKKKSLEIMKYEIEDEMKEEEEQAKKIKQLEELANLSELVRQNENLVMIAEQELAEGIKPKLPPKSSQLKVSNVNKNTELANSKSKANASKLAEKDKQLPSRQKSGTSKTRFGSQQKPKPYSSKDHEGEGLNHPIYDKDTIKENRQKYVSPYTQNTVDKKKRPTTNAVKGQNKNPARNAEITEKKKLDVSESGGVLPMSSANQPKSFFESGRVQDKSVRFEEPGRASNINANFFDDTVNSHQY